MHIFFDGEHSPSAKGRCAMTTENGFSRCRAGSEILRTVFPYTILHTLRGFWLSVCRMARLVLIAAPTIAVATAGAETYPLPPARHSASQAILPARVSASSSAAKPIDKATLPPQSDSHTPLPQHVVGHDDHELHGPQRHVEASQLRVRLRSPQPPTQTPTRANAAHAPRLIALPSPPPV